MSRLRRPFAVALFIGLLALPRFSEGAAAPDLDLDGLAEQIARLRGEIEVLDSRLDEQKESRRTQVRALSAQKGTLEVELQREALRNQQLTDRAARTTERRRVATDRARELTRAVLSAVETMKRTVSRGIPFRLAERTAELDAIAREAESGELLPSAAMERLWSWIDEELKLTRENAVEPQVVKLGDEEILADVAHLGTVALYFRSPDRRFGFARRGGDTWTWEVATAAEDQERIAALFSALDRDAGTGFFVLPGALEGGEAR